mmetsp:Transcript_14553/g.37745  ORF Transcript_14553/g.37745 Transcript_14553/m.37745 type:complete len:220 (-) Transcript_14553:700-1359(-)
MQHLSIQSLGSRPHCARKWLRHACSAVHFCSASSLHEWDTNASTSPKAAGIERAYNAGSGVGCASSSKVSLSSVMERKAASADLCTAPGSLSPMSAAMPAAALKPSERAARKAISRMRTSGMKQQSETPPCSAVPTHARSTSTRSRRTLAISSTSSPSVSRDTHGGITTCRAASSATLTPNEPAVTSPLARHCNSSLAREESSWPKQSARRTPAGHGTQ